MQLPSKFELLERTGSLDMTLKVCFRAQRASHGISTKWHPAAKRAGDVLQGVSLHYRCYRGHIHGSIPPFGSSWNAQGLEIWGTGFGIRCRRASHEIST